MARYISEKDRQTRDTLIMDTALEMLTSKDFAGITMSELAKKCHIAKGTLFLSFPTKETLFAKIMYREYALWAEHEKASLCNSSHYSREEYTSLILKETNYLLKNRMSMISLLAMKRTVISKNVPAEILAEEIGTLDSTIKELARITSERIDFLTVEQIYDLYMTRHAIIIGVYELATSPENIDKIKGETSLHPPFVEFEKTVLKMTEAYLSLYCR